MFPDKEPKKQQPQQRAVSVFEQFPERTKASTAVQFEARPPSTKANNEQNKDTYVVARGQKHTLPTITNTVKTFDLRYKEPFKIRLPNIVTSEPSTITATLHISVEPLTNASKDGLPQIRVLERSEPDVSLLHLRRYWDADFRQQGIPRAFEPAIPGGETPAAGPEAPGWAVPSYFGVCFVCCQKENLNTKFLTSLYGFLNFSLIISLFVLTFLGLRSMGIDYKNKMVVFIAWSQLISHVVVLSYKTYITSEVLGEIAQRLNPVNLN